MHPEYPGTSVHITGRFEVFHKRNLAWILKLKEIAGSDATVRLLPGKPHWYLPDIADRLAFCNAFNLDVTFRAFRPGEDSTGDDAPVPDEGETGRLIGDFIANKRHRCFFPGRSVPADLLPTDRHGILVTVNGCFDVLHPGHIDILQQARSRGDRLMVLINSDTSTRRFKGPDRPVHDQEFRAALLCQLSAVDYVFTFYEDSPLNTLRIIKPNIHVKGGSYLEDRVRQERNLLSEWSGSIDILPMNGHFSTSDVLKHYAGKQFPC
ncbi:adenylyltransferase/cytidyltransferase family protein [bacterium]|nr:adenylyltransferase/cytidyltransferase family protein [candidate division CSSED10-310 bacterium]